MDLIWLTPASDSIATLNNLLEVISQIVNPQKKIHSQNLAPNKESDPNEGESHSPRWQLRPLPAAIGTARWPKRRSWTRNQFVGRRKAIGSGRPMLSLAFTKLHVGFAGISGLTLACYWSDVSMLLDDECYHVWLSFTQRWPKMVSEKMVWLLIPGGPIGNLACALKIGVSIHRNRFPRKWFGFTLTTLRSIIRNRFGRRAIWMMAPFNGQRWCLDSLLTPPFSADCGVWSLVAARGSCRWDVNGFSILSQPTLSGWSWQSTVAILVNIVWYSRKPKHL